MYGSPWCSTLADTLRSRFKLDVMRIFDQLMGIAKGVPQTMPVMEGDSGESGIQEDDSHEKSDEAVK